MNWIMSPGWFRLFLALCVVESHLFVVNLGPAAVYLFFALSGYWIQRMWFKEYYDLAHPYRVFVISRLWRTLPVFYVTVCLFLLLALFTGLFSFSSLPPLSWDTVHFVFSHLTVLGYGTLTEGQRWIKTAWSLGIEIQFYLIAPLLILLFAQTARHSLFRYLLYAIAAAGTVSLLLFYGALPTTGSLFQYLSFFLAGMTAARTDWRPSNLHAKRSLLLTVSVLVVCIALPHVRQLFLWGSFAGPLTAYTAQANTIIACIMLPYALATVYQKGSSVDRLMGNLTYEVYLIHGAAMTIYEQHTQHLSRSAQLPYMAMFIVATIALSLPMYQWIDRPLELARRRFVARQPRRTPIDIDPTLSEPSLTTLTASTSLANPGAFEQQGMR